MIGFILIGQLIQLKKEKKRACKKKISLSEISLIIPFRNEEKRILHLLKSIVESLELPKESQGADRPYYRMVKPLKTKYQKTQQTEPLIDRAYHLVNTINKGINHPV